MPPPFISFRGKICKKSFDQGSIVIEQGSIMDELESLSSSGLNFHECAGEPVIEQGSIGTTLPCAHML